MPDLNDKSERLKIQKDILWGLYQEHRAHGRHNETLRSTVNNMLIVASAALVSIALYDKDLTRRDLLAGFLLMVIGVLGAVFSASYTERTIKHKFRADEYWKELDQTVFAVPVGRSLRSIYDAADKAHKSVFLLRATRAVAKTHWLWIGLPLLIALIGVMLTAYVLVKYRGQILIF